MTQTEQYGLYRWGPGDRPVRAELNGNFTRMDAGLARQRRGTEDNAYHGYNLMLDAYRAGDRRQYQRGLIFDGFADGSRVVQKDEALDLSGGAMVLWRRSAQAPGMPAGNKTTSNGSSRLTPDYLLERSMTVTGFTFLIMANTAGLTANSQVSLRRNGLTAATATLSAALQPGDNQVSVSFSPVDYAPGDTLSLLLGAGSGGSFRCDEDDRLCGYFTVQSHYAPQGSLTGPAAPDGGVERVLAWTRHLGGSAAVRINGQEMALVSQRQSTTAAGAACVESSFLLEVPFSPPITPQITLTAGTSDTVTLFDYGIRLF